MKSFRICFLLLPLFTLCFHVNAAAETATICGQVLDTQGAIVRNAFVLIHAGGFDDRIQPNPMNAMPKLDSMGRFTLQVSPGFFDLCVMSDAFIPVCHKIFIKNGETITRKIRLKVDPEVAKRIAYRVF